MVIVCMVEPRCLLRPWLRPLPSVIVGEMEIVDWLAICVGGLPRPPLLGSHVIGGVAIRLDHRPALRIRIVAILFR